MSHFCSLSKQPFASQGEIQQHLSSPTHAFKCDDCDKSFGSQQSLQQHRNSPVHAPEHKDRNQSPNNQQTPQQHVDSLAHTSTAISQYLGIHSSIVAPIFAAARRLRFQHPTKDDMYILRRIKSDLDVAIVSALVSASWRLLPLDNTIQGKALRTERQRERAIIAKHAEDAFFAKLIRLGYQGLREDQQKGEAITPDFRFKDPTLVCGHLCLWLEFKDYFGFRANPFVAASNKKQYKKYAEKIGSGAVVYKLGFETGHVSINGVMTFREKEVLHDLKSQISKNKLRLNCFSN